MDIINDIHSKVWETYDDEMDNDIVVDDLIQISLGYTTSLVNSMDYLFEEDKAKKEYEITFKASQVVLNKLNLTFLSLVPIFDDIELEIDYLAQEIEAYGLSYYDQTNFITRANTYLKFQNKNLLKSGITTAIGGKINYDLDFVLIKDQLFNLLYHSAEIITNIRGNGVNDKKLKKLIALAYIDISSLNILLNVKIDKV